jgi:hypothetical protein
MPVLVVAEVANVTAEQDDAMVEALNLADDPPLGAQLRLAGPTQTGWRIMSLWDTRESFEAFRRDRLMPVLEKAGQPLPDVQFWPIERVVIR